MTSVTESEWFPSENPDVSRYTANALALSHVLREVALERVRERSGFSGG